MNQNETLKIAAEAGAFWELSDTPEKALAFLMRFAEHATEPLQSRIKDLYRQLDETEKRLDEQYKMGVEAERKRCVLILERLHERSGKQYNYYLHAAKVLKGGGMIAQPEALRLADFLDSEDHMINSKHIVEAAAKLRRLHELNQELLKALETITLMCEDAGNFSNGVTDPTGLIDEGVIRAIEVIRDAHAAIAKARGEK